MLKTATRRTCYVAAEVKLGQKECEVKLFRFQGNGENNSVLNLSSPVQTGNLGTSANNMVSNRPCKQELLVPHPSWNPALDGSFKSQFVRSKYLLFENSTLQIIKYYHYYLLSSFLQDFCLLKSWISSFHLLPPSPPPPLPIISRSIEIPDWV